ncbi:CAP domain-containing protein [Streptomyces sp. NRRL F-5727]|uniref:CAP domain-containing protein n=1 Tax=Streptomyces sp. NRRL F-5727 TaxID=1463871 RepID=UPI000B33120E|nr:CAP domain-containing protein [Streptomyces sp. NRRL F-5727]
MQRTTGADEMTERIRAAQYGDPWACDQVLGAHQPLVHALVSRALVARPSVAAGTVVQETLRRAHGTLHTLPYPEAFRPWLVALAVDTTLAHTAVGLDQAGGWLDVQDAVLAALGSLEDEGLLLRYETAAALQWTPEDTALRMETVRTRVDAARSVGAALARRPRCPRLRELTAGWDGRPGPGWRDHLAAHTGTCAACSGLAPVATAAPAVPGPHPHPEVEVEVEVGAVEADAPTRAYDLGGLAAVPVGPRGTRADRRRRRQVEERTRRRAAVAAGIAVVAVTGGAFSLYGGRGGQEELLEANRATVPGPDVPLSHSPDSLSVSPATSTATPSGTGTPSARPTASATPSAGKTATARPTTATPTPRRTTASPVATPAKPTVAPTTAPEPTRTTAPPTTEPDPGGGRQNDTGQGSAADQVISLVNAERAKAGCGPLTANATLTSAAQGHSDDMAARDFFDHTNPDGDGPGERVTAAGYPWTTYGENIAKGQTTPEQVMDAWMNSPGHRANILNCDFKEIGVGIHTDGGPYWTQVFGAR